MDFGKIGMVEEWLDSFIFKHGPATPWYETWQEHIMMSFYDIIMHSWYMRVGGRGQTRGQV